MATALAAAGIIAQLVAPIVEIEYGDFREQSASIANQLPVVVHPLTIQVTPAPVDVSVPTVLAIGPDDSRAPRAQLTPATPPHPASPIARASIRALQFRTAGPPFRRVFSSPADLASMVSRAARANARVNTFRDERLSFEVLV